MFFVMHNYANTWFAMFLTTMNDGIVTKHTFVLFSMLQGPTEILS